MIDQNISPTPKRVFVAFLDILGFSDLVKENDTQYLLNLYKRGIIEVNEILQKFWETDEWREHVKNPKVRSLTVSDSIILYTEGNGLDSFLKIIVYVHSFINYLISEGLPVRGAITFGDFVNISNRNNNILLGRSIVRAFELEKTQEWAGCVIDDICFERFDYDYKLSSPLKALLGDFIQIIRFAVPFKDINTKNLIFKEMYVINWPIAYHETIPNVPNFYVMKREVIEPAFSKHKKDVNNVGVKLKIENTLKFYDYSIKRPRRISTIRRELTDELMNRYRHED